MLRKILRVRAMWKAMSFILLLVGTVIKMVYAWATSLALDADAAMISARIGAMVMADKAIEVWQGSITMMSDSAAFVVHRTAGILSPQGVATVLAALLLVAAVAMLLSVLAGALMRPLETEFMKKKRGVI